MNSTVQEDLLNIEEIQTPYIYGKFWPRFWALLLDGLILAVLTPFATYNKTEWKSSILFIAIACIQIVYKPFFEYIYGATPGKMALKLRVVNYQYEKASFNEILLRNIYQITGGVAGAVIGLYTLGEPLQGLSFQNFNLMNGAVSVLISVQAVMCILYFVDMGFLLSSADSRSLHDRIGKTFVIKVQ